MDNMIDQSVGLEETTPGLTPLVGENRENDLFQAWKLAKDTDRVEIERRLLQSVRRHASKVCWMVLHSHQPDLIDEISQDVVMDLPSFKEQSAFSTWVHSRATFRCRTQLRQNKQRREISLDTAYASASLLFHESSADTKIFVQEILSRLTPFEKDLVQFKVYEGLSDEQVGVELGFTREWIQRSWSKLRRKLKARYNG